MQRGLGCVVTYVLLVIDDGGLCFDLSLRSTREPFRVPVCSISRSVRSVPLEKGFPHRTPFYGPGDCIEEMSRVGLQAAGTFGKLVSRVRSFVRALEIDVKSVIPSVFSMRARVYLGRVSRWVAGVRRSQSPAR